MPSMASPRSPSMSTRRFGDFVDARAPQPHPVKRWDGAARTCAEWDNLRRDPELWYRNGDCLVHLYAKGQSRRGPSFKVTFSDLLAANCIPLIERSISREGIETIPIRDLPKWTRRSCRRVELYIPPPTNADKTQAFNYHLATRNFFAWVYRRSMVGQTLGEALVGVMHSMNEFRSGVDDNVEDLMGYLDEEGYLNMANQPNHALAMLHLAECFQMKELYIRAFTHAVGMNDALLSSTEYQQMTSKSRKAVRKARLGLNRRLIKSSTMLRTLLDDELSEAHLAIPSGARAHLERFRSFLMSFYTTKFGYFPPQAVDSCCDIFEASVYRTMREDFEALYHLLVDEQYTTSQPMPLSAHGGICTLQLVQSFDKRNRFDPLDHPLPLIPELAGGRRMSLFSKRDKLKPDRRLSAHAALARASNPFKLGLSQNDLVRAYRRFEEDSVVSPNRADKQDKVSLIEARKVRWILVYTIYQVLRSATDVPPEVEQDVEETKYNLAVSTTDIPPWTGSRAFVHLLRRQTDFAKHGSSMQDDDDPASAHIEIKPDIDYFALAHREESRGRPESRRIFSAPNSRSNSLKRALSRSSTIRRSMRMFKSPSHNSAENSPPKRRATYHEILVQGYGNGTNVAKAEEEKIEREPQMEREPEADFSAWAGWEDPWVEPSSEGGSWTPESMESNYDTSDDSPLEMPSPTTCFPEEMPRPLNIKPRGQRRRDVYSMVTRSLSATPVSRRRPVSGLFSDGDKYAEDYEDIVKEQRLSIFGSLSRASSRRSAILPELKRRSHMHGHKVSLQIEEQANMEEPYIMPDDADWQAMEAFMESERLQIEMADHKVMPEWEYADLGGLTEVR